VERRERPLSARPPRTDHDGALDRLRGLLASGTTHRVVLGVTGCPGVGKSTFVAELAAEAELLEPGSVVVVSMDAWHLANDVLVARGSVARKGAPDTFDPLGYLVALRRLRAQQSSDPTVWLPEFRREIEDSVAQAVEVHGDHRLILTEGNYLLLDRPFWADVREELDECWYLELDDETRLTRLAARHAAYGREPAEAERRAREVDQANAELVAPSAERADLIVSLT
jgi:pantothenate kinase